MREIVALPDPVGEELERRTIQDGLELRKLRVPLGRRRGDLRGAPERDRRLRRALPQERQRDRPARLELRRALERGARRRWSARRCVDAGLPEGSVELLAGDRSELEELATAEGLVELVIPRGGEGLKEALKAVATVPVLYAAGGNCHVYVHADADLEMARRIAYNAKVDRPGVCNAAETLLVDAERRRATSCPASLADLAAAGVELVGDGRARAAAGQTAGRRGDRGRLGHRVPRDEDGGRGRRLARGGDRARQPSRHRPHRGDRHRLARGGAAEFTDGVDAAVVFVNASTRFTDGYVFGMGAEIGNSTQKLHARGPIGLRELTTTKYVVHGDGQVRG